MRIHKFNFTELAMRRLAADKLHKEEEGIERNNAAGVGSGHSKKLLAKKLIANGKKMQAQKALKAVHYAKGSGFASTGMGGEEAAPLTKAGLAKIEADAKRAGLKAGFKAGMMAQSKKAATAHKVKLAKSEVSTAKKNLAVGNSKKLVSKSHLLHPKTAEAIKNQQYASSKKFALKSAAQQEIEAAASDEVAKAQNALSFNKDRHARGSAKGGLGKHGTAQRLGKAQLAKSFGAKKPHSSKTDIDIGMQKDEFKALLMAQTEAYAKRPGVTSLVASASEEKGGKAADGAPSGVNPNKHSDLWLAKHGNQDSVGGFKASGHKAGEKPAEPRMSAEDAVAKNLAVAKTQAEAATDTPEELATFAPQVAEGAAAPAAIAARAAAKSKFDCVSLSPTATDNWCLTTCGVSMTSCPKTICRCELKAAEEAATEFAAAAPSGGGLADTSGAEEGAPAPAEDSEASAAEALAKADAEAEADAEAKAEEAEEGAKVEAKPRKTKHSAAWRAKHEVGP